VTPPEFLHADTVHFLHDQSLREFGGHHGLRDEGLLASALARPENRFAYAGEDADLFDLAASYAFGLARNHPFLDANKRTGWASAVLFLRLNEVRLRIPPLIAVPAMVDLACGVVDEAEFARLLRDHSA
jgi:death-on-curing protein